jgi:hypothetical protein
VRGRRPGPLDEGSYALAIASIRKVCKLRGHP